MKKITLFVVLLVSSVSFAQLKKLDNPPAVKVEVVGKAQQFGMPLEAECSKAGNTYTIKFRDAEFVQLTKYREFSFEDVDNTFNDLYAAIEEGFKTMPTEPIILELPNHLVWLRFEKNLGFLYMKISFSTDKSTTSTIYISNPILKKQVEKLFGKR